MRSRMTFIILLLTIMTGLTQRSFASNPNTSDFTSAFEKTIDDKLYIKAGTVHVAPEGIFLCINGQMVSIPQIEADEDGVFMRDVSWLRCPICSHLLTLWGTCSNPDCATNR